MLDRVISATLSHQPTEPVSIPFHRLCRRQPTIDLPSAQSRDTVARAHSLKIAGRVVEPSE